MTLRFLRPVPSPEPVWNRRGHGDNVASMAGKLHAIEHGEWGTATIISTQA
jgi:hypothetical protein